MGDFIDPVGYSWEVSISIHCVHVLYCIAALLMLVAMYTATYYNNFHHVWMEGYTTYYSLFTVEIFCSFRGLIM